MPAAVRVCLLCTCVAWFAVELRQSRNVRHEAHSADRGSILLLRVAAIAGGVAAVAVAHAVPAAAIGSADVTAWVGLGVLWAGLALRVWSVHALGRYFTFTVQTSGDQPVITSGPYRLLRHPAYAGLLLAVIGLATFIANWLSLLVLVTAVATGLGYRITVEERALLDDLGEDYRRYTATHKRLLPFIW